MADFEFLVDTPSTPVANLLLLHGAGAPITSDFMQLLSAALVAQDIAVYRLNFAYMRQTVAGKRTPPSRLPKLMLELTDYIAAMPKDLPLWLGGKSMGARVCSHYLAGDATVIVDGQKASPAQGAIAFGYPFCPPGKDVDRISHFAELKRPLLILQGERDAFGGPNYLEQRLGDSKLKQLAQLSIVPLSTACHDFVPLKRSGLDQQKIISIAARETRKFIDLHGQGNLLSHIEGL